MHRSTRYILLILIIIILLLPATQLINIVLAEHHSVNTLGTTRVIEPEPKPKPKHTEPENSIRSSNPTWPPMEPQQRFGDDFNERAIFVHQDSETYLDDMLFCAAIPAAIHWEGSTRFESLLISDTKNRENGNLIGDYIEYLRKLGASPDLDFIGSVDDLRYAELVDHFDNDDQVTNITTAADVYTGSAQIAEFYWANQRQLGTDTAVLAYVPEPDGGIEVRKDTTGTRTSTFEVDLDLACDEVSWLKFSISWHDFMANTDYRIGIRDPLALHEREYSNTGTTGHVNPTDNRLYEKHGYCELGVSPYYSYMPYSIDSTPQYYEQRQFNGTLAADDVSYYPINGASDYKTYQFGPVKKGQWIGVVTNWTHYVVNETEYRDFDTFIFGPGKTVGDEHLLETSYNPTTILGTTPEVGYCYAEETGYYTVAVHPLLLSKGGDFTTRVYWGSLDRDSTWRARQLNSGSDMMEYHYQEYAFTDDQSIESVTNGAVVASLKNVPLLYTAGGWPEDEIVQTLKNIGIKNLIILDPAERIITFGWEQLGFKVDELESDKEIFNYINEISKSKNLERSLILTAEGGPWFSGAAFAGAYHGAPVPALNDPEHVHIQTQATTTWWQLIQMTDVYDNYPLNQYQPPGQSNMEDLADDFYSWLEKYNPEFNPSCGDLDGDGIPDNGKYWDYTDDIDILVISPLNALKPTLDRAINGKASVGRIQVADPAVLWALLNRQMLYWKVGFSRADNPDDPDDDLPVYDHWKKVGWTFNTYAHDDDIIDYDAGDQDDDDFCGLDDGGANHISYKPRESWPELAYDYGKSSELHTYYTDIRDMLENGTCFWSNNGHGHHYWTMETGLGYTGTSTDPSDPVWAGPNPPENCFIDSPLETTTGWDWYYDMDNIHSTFSMYQSCQVGGSALPEYFLRLGGIGVIGGVVSRALIEATIQSDRTTKGLFSGMTFGEAHRWGIDEVGCIYSLKDPGDSNIRNMSMNFDDELTFRNGDTGQTVLYGDPNLVMIAPTLFLNTNWEYQENEINLTFTVTVRDQSGYKLTPDTFEILLDSKELTFKETFIGTYIANSPIPTQGEHRLIVSTSKSGYKSSNNQEVITREYDLFVPTINLTVTNFTYKGGENPQIDLETFGALPEPLNIYLDDSNTKHMRLEILNEDQSNTGHYCDLNYFDNGRWSIADHSVSDLPNGKYHVVLYASVNYWPDCSTYAGNFTIKHILIFPQPEVKYFDSSKILTLQEFRIKSSYAIDGIMSSDKLSIFQYELFYYADHYTDRTTNIIGNLDFNTTQQKFELQRLDLINLTLGKYYLQVSLAAPYTKAYIINTSWFDVTCTLYLSDLSLDYTGGLVQRLEISNISLTLIPDSDVRVPLEMVSEHRFSIHHMDWTPLNLTGDLQFDNSTGTWFAQVNVTYLPEGNYRVSLYFNCTGYGTITKQSWSSDTFGLEHLFYGTPPEISYNNDDFILRVYNVTLWSSINGTGLIKNASMVKGSYEIYNDSDDEYAGYYDIFEYNDNTWQARLNVSGLSDGTYHVLCLFEFEGLERYFYTERFTVEHWLTVSRPEVYYDPEEDSIHIFNLKPYSSKPMIGYLEPKDVTNCSVRILDEMGNIILTGELEFNKSWSNYTFFKTFNNISKILKEGIYYIEVTFATPYQTEISNTSLPFEVKFEESNKNDDDGSYNTSSLNNFLYFLISFIICLIITVIILLNHQKIISKVKRVKKSQDENANDNEQLDPFNDEIKEENE